MKIGRVEIKVAPNLYFLAVFGCLAAIDWRLGLGFLALSVGSGAIGWWMHNKLHLDERSAYAPSFVYKSGKYVPMVVFRGTKSRRKRGVALVLEKCRCNSPDEAVAEASALVKVLNEEPPHTM